MSDIAALLDDRTQAAFRGALNRGGETGERTKAENLPRDETLAALAILGRQPAEIQPATLTIMPIGIRHELLAYGYAEVSDTDEVRCHLTDEGARTASLLAEAIPAREDEQQEARENLKALLDEVREDVGPIDNPESEGAA